MLPHSPDIITVVPKCWKTSSLRESFNQHRQTLKKRVGEWRFRSRILQLALRLATVSLQPTAVCDARRQAVVQRSTPVRPPDRPCPPHHRSCGQPTLLSLAERPIVLRDDGQVVRWQRVEPALEGLDRHQLRRPRRLRIRTLRQLRSLCRWRQWRQWRRTRILRRQWRRQPRRPCIRIRRQRRWRRRRRRPWRGRRSSNRRARSP